MIVGTSALVAVLRRKEGCGPILDALVRGEGLIPAPVPPGFARVSAGGNNAPDTRAGTLASTLLGTRAAVPALGAEAARLATAANEPHRQGDGRGDGRGDGQGGLPDILGLTVLGCARAGRRPILCTGRNLAAGMPAP